MNDLYLKYDDSTDQVTENFNIKIDKVENTNLILLIILIIISMLFFILLAKHIIKFNHKREYLFNILLKVEVKELKILLSKLQRFYNILSKSYENKALFIHCNQIQKEFSKKTNNIRNYSKKNSRSARFEKLNSKNYFLLLLAFFLIATAISIFSTIFIVIQAFNNYEFTKFNQMDFVQDSIFYNAIGIAFVDEYISENKTSTMLTEDITSVFDDVIYRLNNTDSFIQMFTGDNGLLDPNFSEFITTDFCQSGTAVQKESCKLLSIPAEMGILGIDNFLFRNLEELAIVYRDSDQTENFMRNLLSSNSFFEVLAVYEIYVKPLYQSMSEIINNQLIDEINYIQSTIILLGLIIGIAILIFGIMMRKIIMNTMKNQGKILKGILKLLPINVILDNYSLKLYLIETSKNTLEPIKRYL